jgi:transposase
VRRWLERLELEPVDRLEMDQLLAQWELLERQLADVQEEIHKRCLRDQKAQLIGSMTGKVGYTSLAIASRIGPIERFPRARAFTNYWGLTPCCDSSGESERLGHISKDGSPIVRFPLGQLVLHMLRRDPGLKRWYQSVQKRRGTKIARVAVMRKLAASIWHMVRYHEPYRLVYRRDRHGVPPARSTPPARPESHPSAAWR